jgi:hypothetical protein
MRNNHDDHENRPVKHGLTEAQRARVLELYFERAAWRQYLSDANFLAAVKLGKKLKALKEG